MMDFARIKRNIGRMIDQNAPEADIDAYVASEGVTPEMLRGEQSAQVQSAGKADMQQPEMSMGAQAYDVLRSAGTGVRRGAEFLAGLPGDMNSLVQGASDFVAGQMGVDPAKIEQARALSEGASLLPTSQDVQQATTSVVGDYYQPQTTAGEYAKTIGEFAPAAIAGPGGVARKAAMAVVPGAASEAAGQATEGTDMEPYARAAAAILGGVGVAGARGKAMAQLAKDAPSPEALQKAKTAAYDKLKQSGVVFDNRALDAQVVKTVNEMTNEGLLQSLAPKTYSIIDRLDAAAKGGGILDFNAIEAARKAAGKLVRSSDSEERAAAIMLRDAIDDFTAGAPLVNQGGVPRQQFIKMQKEARDLARRDIQQKVLSDILESSQDYAAGVEAGIRNQVNSLLRSKRGKQLFRNPAEKAALRRVAQDRKTLQQLSRFGFDVTGGSGNAALIPGATAITGAVTGNPLAVGATVAGSVAKVASPMLTKRALNKAQAIVRAGPKAQAKALSDDEVQALETFVRRAIAANNARLAAE